MNVNYIRCLFQTYKPLSYIGLAFVLLMAAASILKGYALNIAGDIFPIQLYAKSIVHVAAFLLQSLGHESQALGQKLFLHATNIRFLKAGISYLSLNHQIFLSIAALLLPLKALQKCKIILLILGTIFIFNVLRMVAISIGIENFQIYAVRQIREFFNLALNIAFIYAFVFWFRYHKGLKLQLIKQFGIKASTLRLFIRRAALTLVFLSTIKFIVNSNLLPLSNYMSYSILWLTSGVLHLLGYITEVENFRHLKGSLTGIRLADPCLGINLMLTFASFIAIVNGALRNKIWFIGSGLLVIYALNIVRMTLLYMYLSHHRGRYATFLEIHDLYNYSIYMLTFILWVVWIHRYGKEPNIKPAAKATV